jgi:hypothetical protein
MTFSINYDGLNYCTNDLKLELDLVWTGDEVAEYEALRSGAAKTKQTLPGYVKSALRNIQVKRSS